AGDEATRPVGRCLPQRRPTGVWNDHDPRCSPTASVWELFQESGGVVISSTGDGPGGRQVRASNSTPVEGGDWEGEAPAEPPQRLGRSLALPTHARTRGKVRHSKEEGVTVARESGAVSLLERCATQTEGGGLSEAELRRLESWCSQACERSRST